MIKKNVGIIKSMGIYTISNVINAAIPFLMLPILTRYLSTTDYGILSNFSVISNFLIPLVGINLMASIQVQYLKDDVDNRNYLTSVFRLNIFLGLLFTLAVVVFSDFVNDLTGVPVEILYLMGGYALFHVTIEVLLAVWRMEDRAINYGLFRIGRTVLELALVVIFVVVLRLDFIGSIYAMLISYGIASLIAVVILFQKGLIFGKFHMPHLKHGMNYGVPLIPHALSGMTIMYSDKLIITHYLGLDANGIYSVGFLVGQSIGLLQNSFNQAWLPWVFQKLKAGKDADKLRMVKITYLYILMILIAALVLWFVSPLVFSILGKEFKAGMDLVLWIGMGFAFNGMYKMVSVYLFYLEKTKIIAMMSLGVATVNVVLNFILIPEYGVEGAAMATLTAMFLQFVVAWIISSRLIKMPWVLK